MCWVALIPLAIGAVSGMMQGQAQQSQANSQAAALRRNAVYLGNAAADARVRGMQKADWKRVEGQQLIGTQRAAMAANGGMVDQDTNALLQQDTAQLAEFDALTISNNAAREAYGYEVQQSDALRTAKTVKAQGNKAVMSSVLGGALQGGMSSFGGGGGMFASASGGLNMQGQSSALTSNAAFVRNM